MEMFNKLKWKLLLLVVMIGVIACNNENELSYKEAEGSIVGYCKKYYLDSKEELQYDVGLYIVVDSKVFLSFSDVDYHSLGLEPDDWAFSVHSFTRCFGWCFHGDDSSSVKVRFSYREAVENEIIDATDYHGPVPAICPGPHFGPTDAQIIIKNIKKEN